MNGRERCLAVLHGQPADRVPVFPLVMHFAQARHGISYRTYASDGAALAEAQLRLADDFRVDAITACSDAFRISADLGANIVFAPDHPPHAEPLVRSRSDLLALRRNGVLTAGSRSADRVHAVEVMVRHAGHRLLVAGWVDMPFAEACSLCGVEEFMTLLYDDVELAHEILRFLTPIVIDFACVQLAAGAPLVGCGDAAASLLSVALYERFALPYEREVIAAIHAAQGLAKLHICGDTRRLLPSIAGSGADLINVDHLVPAHLAAATYGAAGVAWKGNLDPVADLLHAAPERTRERARACRSAASGQRFMLSAGCEIARDTPAASFAELCQAGA